MYAALANTNIAHTIGNVTFIMVEYLRSLFPENFFNYVHLGTRIAYKEFMQEEAQIRGGFIKKSRPILVVRPRPILFDDDIFLARSPWMYPIIGTANNPDRSEYIRCFRDNEKDITLSYKLNRMRVQCLVTLMFDTDIQQQNIYLQLRNRFDSDRPYWMKTATEILIPFGIMETISKLADIPIYHPESGTPRIFLNYLMAHANKYFTYKKNSGTQQDDFFLYYPETIECVFTDFNLEDANRKGQTNENSNITFTFTTEFNTIAMYQLSTETDNEMLKANEVVHMDTSSGISYIPMYTMNNVFRTENKDGFKLFFTNIFNTDPEIPREEPDILDLSNIFKDSALDEIIEYYNKNGMAYETLFDFVMMKNNKMLNHDKAKPPIDYELDLDHQRILIWNKSKTATYRLLIYVNNLKIMELSNIISDLKNSYESEAQTSSVKVKGEKK